MTAQAVADSQNALNKATEATSAIQTHLAICEEQNRVIIKRLDAQDQLLGPINDGIRLLKTISGGAVILYPLFEVWRHFSG